MRLSSSIFKNKYQYYYNTDASCLCDFPKRLSHALRSFKNFLFYVFFSHKMTSKCKYMWTEKDGLSKVDLHLFIRNRLTFKNL